MGYRNAMDAATIMADMAGLDAALEYHLTVNHFPPVPAVMIEVAKEAITLASTGNYDHDIELPEGISHKSGSSSIPVDTIIESLHLEPFVAVAMAEEEE